MSVEGGAPTYFAWAGGTIIAEYEPWGTNALIWKTSYIYLGGRLLVTTSGADGNETRFHHPDRLGTRMVTGLDGTVVTEQLTMPFGTMLPFTQNYGGENSYQNPTLANPSKKRFTTYDRSDATGLDYAVNRFYSSQQGRFTQVDPIGGGASSLSDPQTLNLYAYCGNDPINCVDPDGLFFGKLFGWIGKAFKFLFKVAAVALVVAAMVVLPGSAVAGLALLGLAGASGLAGWHNGKLGTIVGRILSAGLAWKGNARTPNTFPGGAGVGGVNNFLQSSDEIKRQERALAQTIRCILCDFGFDCEQLSKLSARQVFDLYNALRNGQTTVTTDGVTINVVPIQPGVPGPIVDPLPPINKAINTDIRHTASRAVERGISTDAKTAADGLRNLSREITQKGWPQGAIRDTAHADRVLVPFGNGGYAVYQVMKNGTARLKTVLIVK